MIRADYIVIGALILLVGAHVTTNFLLTYYQDVAKTMEYAEEIVLEFEANPVAKWFFRFAGLKQMYSYVIAPGLLIGLYYFLRKKYLYDPFILESYSIALFCFFFLNFMNDIGLALGILMG